HRPWSPTGLWAMALGGLLAALNPIRTGAVSDGPMRVAPSRSNIQRAITFEQFCAGLLLLVPPWLVYFSQVPVINNDLSPEGALQPWPILATTTAIFLTGLFARLFPERLAPAYLRWPRTH